MKGTVATVVSPRTYSLSLCPNFNLILTLLPLLFFIWLPAAPKVMNFLIYI